MLHIGSPTRAVSDASHFATFFQCHCIAHPSNACPVAVLVVLGARMANETRSRRVSRMGTVLVCPVLRTGRERPAKRNAPRGAARSKRATMTPPVARAEVAFLVACRQHATESGVSACATSRRRRGPLAPLARCAGEMRARYGASSLLMPVVSAILSARLRRAWLRFPAPCFSTGHTRTVPLATAAAASRGPPAPRPAAPAARSPTARR
jgi:hypothetical protein